MWTLQRSATSNTQTAAKESLATKSFTLQRLSNVQRDNNRIESKSPKVERVVFTGKRATAAES
ncbi:hypothetical protein OUZ56_004536 [Daphnia magna]|uniref:Uncharacterized protein n=1 Tax=Daphnia magna TaxID=35525 RepID=A0ABQ9YQ38_9CRUS|nr:hypothetical protein OUZ56_004536 [Daphnia magna]